MLCKVQKNSEMETLSNSRSTSREGRFCRNTVGQDFMHQRRGKSNTLCAHNIDAYESRRCRIHDSGKQRHEEHVADVETILEVFLQFGTSADTNSEGTENSSSTGGSGQATRNIEKYASSARIQREKNKHDVIEFAQTEGKLVHFWCS